VKLFERVTSQHSDCIVICGVALGYFRRGCQPMRGWLAIYKTSRGAYLRIWSVAIALRVVGYHEYFLKELFVFPKDKWI